MRKSRLSFAFYLSLLLLAGCEPSPVVVFDAPSPGRGYNLQHILGDSVICIFESSPADTHKILVYFDRDYRTNTLVLDREDTLLSGKIIRRNGLYYGSIEDESHQGIFAFSVHDDTIKGLSKYGAGASIWSQNRYLYEKHKDTDLMDHLVDEDPEGSWYTVHTTRRLLRQWFSEVPDSCDFESIIMIPESQSELDAIPASDSTEERIMGATPSAVKIIQPKLFPNPATDQITVIHSSTCQQIEILSTDGSQVGSYNPEGSETICDIRNIPPGHYLVRLRDSDGKASVLRLECIR